MIEESVKLVEKYAWRGWTVLNFCPGCFRKLYSAELAQYIGKVWRERPHEVANIFTSILGIAGFSIFIPGNEEQAQLLNHRYVIYPFCRECATQKSKPEFLEKIIQNIIWARRTEKIIKGGS